MSKSILIALTWAAVLICLPLLAKTGLISAAAIKGIAPTLTVLAVVHLSSRGRAASRCGAARS